LFLDDLTKHEISNISVQWAVHCSVDGKFSKVSVGFDCELLLASTPQFVIQTHLSGTTLNCPLPFLNLRGTVSRLLCQRCTKVRRRLLHRVHELGGK
jgi:hypothetical protein